MKNIAPSPVTRKDVSLAIARLMPLIMRGVQMDFFVKRGVTQTQFLMMAAIRAYARCSMTTLARNLHIAMPTATGIVDRLVRAGYVRRVARPDDRRQVAVELTPKAQQFFHEFEAVIRRRWEEALTALEPHDLHAFHTVISKLRDRLQPTMNGDA
jgi:DNA-binding MarR family transcriptional regulator